MTLKKAEDGTLIVIPDGKERVHVISPKDNGCYVEVKNNEDMLTVETICKKTKK